MPPLLMLFADAVLVAYLYYRDTKSSQRVSGISWVFAIWFILMGSRSLAAWLRPGTESEIVTGTESNPIIMISGLAFAAFGLYVIIRRHVDVGEIVRLNAPLFVLFGYSLLSCLWSEDPMISLRRWIRMMLEALVIIAILAEHNRLGATKKLIERYAVLAVPLSIVMIKYFPELGVRWDNSGNSMMWTGVTLHKNALGIGLATCILYYVWKWVVCRDFTRWKTDSFLCLLSCYLLFNPEVKGSSTSTLSLIPAVGLLALLGRRRSGRGTVRPLFYLVLLAAFGINVGARALWGKGLLEWVTQLSGREMTFTGRTYIWQAVTEEAAKSPIFGTGYGAFWIGSRLDRLHARYLVNDIYQAHNGYLETYASLGAIGLLLLVVFLLVGIDRGLRRLTREYELNSLAVAYSVFFILAEFFEATALSYSTFRWIVLLLLLIRMPQRSISPVISDAPQPIREERLSTEIQNPT